MPTKTTQLSRSIQAPAIKPLTKRERKRAKAYIEQCEKNRRYGDMYKNFDAELHAYFNRQTLNGKRSPIMHTFVDYVIEEVEINNFLDRCPFYQVHHHVMMRLCRQATRRDSRYLWKKTTKYHAQLHRELINDMLIQNGFYLGFKYRYDRNMYKYQRVA